MRFTSAIRSIIKYHSFIASRNAYTPLFTRSLAAAASARGAGPQGQAPSSARRPIENTHLEQNPHLKHASKGGKGAGKAPTTGNAAEDPELPSHQLSKRSPTKEHGKTGGQGKRGLHTSSASLAEKDGSKHSAESYFKDVDNSEAPSSSTYTVGGDDATKAHRPNEQYADPKKQYATVSKEEPYQPPASEAEEGGKHDGNVKGANLRYGGTGKETEKDVSHPKESPAEGNAGGRKAEGR